MGAVKGSAIAGIGYACALQQLVMGWRAVWSATPGTTDPNAPFGVATLATSGSEGGPNMGAMRWAQTVNYGVLPAPTLPATFVAQVYDLDDTWGPEAGPCFTPWGCCAGKTRNATSCAGRETLCAPACAADADTTSVMGSIHPRSKKEVGDRLGRAAYNTVYGGSAPFTGPTLSSCSVAASSLTVRFNTTLLRGDTLALQPIVPYFPASGRGSIASGGSQLWVQTNASVFCMEATCPINATTGGCDKIEPTNPRSGNAEYCPTYAGGDGVTIAPEGTFNADATWTLLNFTAGADGVSVVVDLTPLQGAAPTAVRYAWGLIDCCDHSDPNLYVTHGCIATCPIMSSSGLPANPFQAKIVGGQCECIAPQVC
jgi:hypothetical protein